MSKIKKGFLIAALVGAVSLTPAGYGAEQPFVTTVYAHGHHGGGGYHGYCGGGGCASAPAYFYCGGHGAHQHANGVCPYADTSVPKQQNKEQSVKKSTIKKVQKKLKKLGYRCGKASGVMNVKTKKALKRFQKDYCLKVNGAIKKQTLRTLGL